jgi:hypothetical protein
MESYWGQVKRPWYLSREGHDRRIKGRTQRIDVGKYCFVKRTARNYLQICQRLSLAKNII